MKRALAPIVFGGLIALTLIIYTISYQVRYTEVAVKLTWKRPTAIITEPGLYWKMPWPIQEVVHFDKRIRTLERRTLQVATLDNKTMVITPFANWQIKPDRAKDFLVQLGTVKSAETKLMNLLADACSSRIGQTRLSDLLSTSPDKKDAFATLEKNIQDDLGKAAEGSSGQANLYGIEVASVGLKRLQLDEQVTAGAFQAMIQERQSVAQRYRSEGQSRSALIRSSAESKRNVIEAAAQAEADKTRANAIKMAADQFYATFAANEDLHNFLTMLETARRNFLKRTTFFIDGRWDVAKFFAQAPQLAAGPTSRPAQPLARKPRPAGPHADAAAVPAPAPAPGSGF